MHNSDEEILAQRSEKIWKIVGNPIRCEEAGRQESQVREVHKA